MRVLRFLVLVSSLLLVIGCAAGSGAGAADYRRPDNVVGLTHGHAIEILDDYHVTCCDRSCCDAANHHYHYQDARVVSQGWDGVTVTLTYHMIK